MRRNLAMRYPSSWPIATKLSRLFFPVVFCQFIFVGVFGNGWAQEQNLEECRFSIQNTKRLDFQVYLPCSRAVAFDSDEAVITVKFKSLSSAEVGKTANEKVEAKVILSDGRELSELRPVRPDLPTIGGKLLMGGMVTELRSTIPWAEIVQIKGLDWKNLEDKGFPASLPIPDSSIIKFQEGQQKVPAGSLHVFTKGKYTTSLSYFGVGPGLKVDTYYQEAFNVSHEKFLVELGFLEFNIPCEKILSISPRQKVIVLRNSEQIPFDHVELAKEVPYLKATTFYGEAVFEIGDLEFLEFTDRQSSPWSPPNPKLIEYEIMSYSESTYKTYRTKKITTSLIVGQQGPSFPTPVWEIHRQLPCCA